VQTELARSWHAWLLRRIDDPHAFVRKVMVNSAASLVGVRPSADCFWAVAEARLLAALQAAKWLEGDGCHRATRVPLRH
jgi:hypothetical protein